ncbi:hypothetical protein GQX73_g444 [Xylaria multiplex]|uniref:Uncharacterized protein n=1 Tax=Xylaria multiplex TaxID=323545 RepID=A0A7C8N0M9_9PEZI|nr:hypothetical protein GQX73_g444 [Xylaria multiplex]
MTSTTSHQTLLSGPGPYISSNTTNLATISEIAQDSNSRGYYPVPQQDASAKFGPPIKPSPQTSKKVTTSSPEASTRGSSWTWEYVLLALSTGAVVSLITVLAYINNIRLSDWKGPVSPNTTVSILAAITRASLGFVISSCIGQAKWNWFKKRPDSLLTFDRFDDASRGPWGSFWLIVWVKTFHWVVIGSAVTIVLLAFEPFLQAIISFRGSIGSANTAYSAKISRSVFLDAGTYFKDGTTDLYNILTSSNQTITLEGFKGRPDLGMVAAINNGFYNSYSTTSNPVVLFTCPTANCTWAPTTTLAVCSTCNDVTSHITIETIEGEDLGTVTYSGLSMNTNWTSKSLPYLSLTNPQNSYGGGPKQTAQFSLSAWLAAAKLTDPKATISFHNLSTIITAIGIIKAADGYAKGDLTWDDTPVTATECALYFCTQAMNSSIVAGKLIEEGIASWSERDYSTYVGNKTTVFDEWNNYSLYTNSHDIVRNDLVLLIPPEDAQRFNLPENVTTKFNLSQNTIGSTVTWVNNDFFAGTMAWPLIGHIAVDAPPVMQALYQSTNLTATFDNVAASLSNWMRSTSDTTHYGVVQDWVIRINIEWPYVIAPLLAFSLGLIFCLHSISETRRLGLQPWKTSMVATLTHSVDAGARAQLRHAHRNGDIDKTAKAMIICFEDAGSGLELRAKQA